MSPETKNYIDDNVRKSTDSAIQTVTNHLGVIADKVGNIKVILENVKVTGENTFDQAKKTNGRVDSAKEDISNHKEDINDLKISLAVAREQHRLIKIVAIFITVVMGIQVVSMITGVPTNELFSVILKLI